MAKPIEIMGTSYKADYKLIPKHEEAEYCRKSSPRQEKILPRFIDAPPLLREYLKEETGQENPQIPLIINKYGYKNYRLAEEDETPNVQLKMGLGTPVNPRLYPSRDVESK